MLRGELRCFQYALLLSTESYCDLSCLFSIRFCILDILFVDPALPNVIYHTSTHFSLFGYTVFSTVSPRTSTDYKDCREYSYSLCCPPGPFLCYATTFLYDYLSYVRSMQSNYLLLTCAFFIHSPRTSIARTVPSVRQLALSICTYYLVLTFCVESVHPVAPISRRDATFTLPKVSKCCRVFF